MSCFRPAPVVCVGVWMSRGRSGIEAEKRMVRRRASGGFRVFGPSLGAREVGRAMGASLSV